MFTHRVAQGQLIRNNSVAEPLCGSGPRVYTGANSTALPHRGVVRIHTVEIVRCSATVVMRLYKYNWDSWNWTYETVLFLPSGP